MQNIGFGNIIKKKNPRWKIVSRIKYYKKHFEYYKLFRILRPILHV